MSVFQESLDRRIQEVASPIAKALQIELIDVTIHGRGGGSVVRVTIDKAGGVAIGECEQLHHSLSRALDVIDPMPHSYRLEVSSPGLDRPLNGEEDYRRSIGKKIRVTLQNPVCGQWVVVGRLVALDPQGVRLGVASGNHEKPIELAWGDIRRGRLEVEF